MAQKTQCKKCNTGIGMLQDSVEVLSKAAEYLAQYETGWR